MCAQTGWPGARYDGAAAKYPGFALGHIPDHVDDLGAGQRLLLELHEDRVLHGLDEGFADGLGVLLLLVDDLLDALLRLPLEHRFGDGPFVFAVGNHDEVAEQEHAAGDGQVVVKRRLGRHPAGRLRGLHRGIQRREAPTFQCFFKRGSRIFRGIAVDEKTHVGQGTSQRAHQ